jgi:hypothetical protein
MGPSDSCARHALAACSVFTPPAQASRVAHSTLHACRAHYPGGPPSLVDCFHPALRPSPFLGRVGAHVSPLGTCSGFTHVAACVLARPPFKGLLLRGFGSGSRPPSPPDGFRGASTIPRAGLPPAGERAPSRRTQKRTKSAGLVRTRVDASRGRFSEGNRGGRRFSERAVLPPTRLRFPPPPCRTIRRYEPSRAPDAKDRGHC